jgi:hypothetical protein
VEKSTCTVLRGGDDGNIIPLTRPWRRGKRFGSMLVNLETHKIIGLLADREAESVRQWLATHPEVDVVSRDRGKVSIDGATDGEPLRRYR